MQFLSLSVDLPYKATICVIVGKPFKEVGIIAKLAVLPLSIKLVRGETVSFFESAHLCRKALEIVVIT